MSKKSKVNRRQFLKMLGAGTCGAAVHSTLGAAPGMMAYAAPLAGAISSNPLLVIVNFAGGASYNVAPVYHGAYRDANPTISYGPEDSFAINDLQGIHPSLTCFHDEWANGKLALVNMVGYPNPNRSHAESTDIWFRGLRDAGGALGGWGGRLTCQMSGIFSGVSLSGANNLIAGGCNPGRALGNLDALGESRFKYNDDRTAWLQMTRENLMATQNSGDNEAHMLVKDAMNNLQLSLKTVKEETQADLPDTGIDFPNSGFGRACRDTARLLQAPRLGTRFIYLSKGGFDTHSGERARLTNLLDDVNGGLSALIAAAKAMGRWNDLIIVTMSEFCRTFENASFGTDHGHAAPLYVTGGAVAGGSKSDVPSWAETDGAHYYRYMNVDFRLVFKEVVSAMGYDADMVFPETVSFSPLGLFS